jgi:hypothetical protein
MWGRVIKVEIWDAEGELVLETDELRVDINYLHQWGTNDLCSVQIFNLGLPAFKTLVTYNKLTIKLSVGHRDSFASLPVLLQGHINNVWGQKIVPHHITHLYCVPDALYLATRNKPLPSAHRLTKLGEYVEELAALIEIGEVNWVGKASQKWDKKLGKRNQDTNIYSELITVGYQNQLKIRIHGNQMTVHVDPRVDEAIEEAKEDKDANVALLNTVLLRGTPRLSASKIVVPYALSTELHAGTIIDVGTPSMPNSIASIAEVSGLLANLNRDTGIIDYSVSRYYMIDSISHEASAFTKRWHSNITAYMKAPNLKGDK